MDKEVFTYCVDNRDIIIGVSRNWESFARSNSWDGETSPEDVVGHSLWNFVQGFETQHLYEEVFRIVRSGKTVGPIPLRCDSPQERRFLTLLLSPLPDGQIEIKSTITRTERRDPIKLLDKDAPRSDELLRICSMCKKIATNHNTWAEIEEGLSQLRLFEAKEMPNLTHGLCKYCYKAVAADLGDPEPMKSDVV
jgi:hypothetical protein